MRPPAAWPVLLAAALTATAIAASPDTTRANGPAAAESAGLAVAVHELFDVKCSKCHGAGLPRPKGKFGHVLDLARVAANPDHIIPGDPAGSELFRLIEEDEMPGEKSGIAPLTAAEKDLVRRWIAQGATTPPNLDALVGAWKTAQAAAPGPPAARQAPPALSWSDRLLRWAGRFHPFSAHYPVALLTLAGLLEFVSWFKIARAGSRCCIALGAPLCLVSAALGWIHAPFAGFTGSSATLLAWHRWTGVGVAAASVALFLISEYTARSRDGSRAGLRAALIGTAIAVLATGWLGSVLVNGFDYYRP